MDEALSPKRTGVYGRPDKLKDLALLRPEVLQVVPRATWYRIIQGVTPIDGATIANVLTVAGGERLFSHLFEIAA